MSRSLARTAVVMFLFSLVFCLGGGKSIDTWTPKDVPSSYWANIAGTPYSPYTYDSGYRSSGGGCAAPKAPASSAWVATETPSAEPAKAVSATLSDASTDAETRLNAMKRQFDASLSTIIAGQPDAINRYSLLLDACVKDLQKKGDLDGLLAIRREKLRWEKEQSVPNVATSGDHPAVLKVRKEYRQGITRSSVEVARLIIALADKHLADLTAWKRDLVKSGQIDDAVAVQAEGVRAMTTPFVAEARSVIAQATATNEDTADSGSGVNTIYVPVGTTVKVPGPSTLGTTGSSNGGARKQSVVPAGGAVGRKAYGRIGQRWAVVIGVSEYADTRIQSLRYAAQDAQAFYDWLVSPTGGKYAPVQVKLLLDSHATARNIREALFTWLKQALEEDSVTIFFACHGSPESPDETKNLYLLPCDTEYDNVASTAFPMWDVETALQKFIKAKRVIVLADACHSGGVGESFDVARRSNRAFIVNPIASAVNDLGKVGNGYCVISASNERQLSREGQEWGGGHGVFTYFLLRGLRGEADYNKDAAITLGELIPYLSEQVGSATRNAQTPTVAGRFDPALTVGR